MYLLYYFIAQQYLYSLYKSGSTDYYFHIRRPRVFPFIYKYINNIIMLRSNEVVLFLFFQQLQPFFNAFGFGCLSAVEIIFLQFG